jgi:hypothetical protein
LFLHKELGRLEMLTTTLRNSLGVAVAAFVYFACAPSAICGPIHGDVSYIATREWDPVLEEYYTRYENLYDEDALGNPIYTAAIPIYSRVGPDPWIDPDHPSRPFWLPPGWSVEVRPDRPGDPGGIQNAMQVNPNAGNKWTKFRIINVGIGKFEVDWVVGNTEKKRFKPTPETAWENVTLNQVCKAGECWRFRGERGAAFTYHYDADPGMVSGGDNGFSGVFAILGDPVPFESNIPGLVTAPWHYWYIGDFHFSDSDFGAGFGNIAIQGNTEAFMSIVTPEAYVGCVVPEPSSFALAFVASISLGVFAFKRRSRAGTLCE